jgi:hypothetical protein
MYYCPSAFVTRVGLVRTFYASVLVLVFWNILYTGKAGDVDMCVLGSSGLIYVSSNIPDQAGVNYKTLKYVLRL